MVFYLQRKIREKSYKKREGSKSSEIFSRANFVTVSGLRKIVVLNYLQPVLVKVRAGTGFSRVHVTFEWSNEIKFLIVLDVKGKVNDVTLFLLSYPFLIPFLLNVFNENFFSNHRSAS